MSATITWEIQWMQCYPQADGQTDVVFQVGWQCSGVQDTYNASVYATCAVPAPSGSSFTPFDQLTQSQVLNWIWANGVDQAATEAAVQGQIDNQINPPVVTPPLPWAA
jgi:hypothetical protein